MKKCTHCNKLKPFSEYVRKASSKDGLVSNCNPCRKAKKRDEYQRNRQKYLDRSARYREENPGKVREAKQLCYQKRPDHYRRMHKDYYQNNRDARLEYAERYRQENRDLVLERHREYGRRNRVKKCEKQKQYYRRNRDSVLQYHREYREANKEKISDRQKKYCKENADKIRDRVRRKIMRDPLFALSCSVRKRTHKAIAGRGFKKGSTTAEILGCSFKTLRDHIESQFKPGMGWHNRSEWHIDHIIPLASANTEEELIKLCHYTNLQPLWAEENLSKGAKVIALKEAA